MKAYVAGFAFSSNKRHVVLITKNRPEWQAGNLNGVGGHIEENEMPIDAMVREYLEETGVQSASSDWKRFAVLCGPHFLLYFYAAFDDALVNNIETLTDEYVDVYSIETVLQQLNPYRRLIPNLTWLLPLAIDSQREGFNLSVNAEYL